MKPLQGLGTGLLFGIASSPISAFLVTAVDWFTKPFPFVAKRFFVDYVNIMIVTLVVTAIATIAILAPCAYVLSRTSLISSHHLMFAGLAVGLSLGVFEVFGPMLDVFLVVFAAAGGFAGYLFGFGLERRISNSA